MTKKCFTEVEIFNLLLAEYSAYCVEFETSYKGSWTDFASEETYRDHFVKLGNNANKFEKKLRETAIKAESELKRYYELNSNDFDDIDEYKEYKNEIKCQIMDIAIENLQQYIKD